MGSPTGASGLGNQTAITRLTLVIIQVVFGVVDDSKDNDQDVVEEPAPGQLDLAHHGLLEQLARRHHHRLPPGQPHQVHIHVVSGNSRVFFFLSNFTSCLLCNQLTLVQLQDIPLKRTTPHHISTVSIIHPHPPYPHLVLEHQTDPHSDRLSGQRGRKLLYPASSTT